MRSRLRAAHGKAVHARRSRPATLAPKQFRRSPAAANPGPIHPRAAPANRIPQLPLATPAAAIEAARETTLQIGFLCASLGQNPQFPIKLASPLLGTPSLSQKRHKPANGTEIAQDPEDTNPVKGRSGLTLWLVVERYVAIDWTRRRVREEQCGRGLPRGVSFRRRNETWPAANRPLHFFNFKRSVRPFSPLSQIQTFNCSDSQRPRNFMFM